MHGSEIGEDLPSTYSKLDGDKTFAEGVIQLASNEDTDNEDHDESNSAAEDLTLTTTRHPHRNRAAMHVPTSKRDNRGFDAIFASRDEMLRKFIASKTLADDKKIQLERERFLAEAKEREQERKHQQEREKIQLLTTLISAGKSLDEARQFINLLK